MQTRQTRKAKVVFNPFPYSFDYGLPAVGLHWFCVSTDSKAWRRYNLLQFHKAVLTPGVIVEESFATVLVSARTELSLFLVAGTVLCFGFSVRMMLITF